MILFDFDKDFDFAAVKGTDVKVSESKGPGGSALRLETGRKEPWPGINLPAPKGHWDLSEYKFLAIEVKNVGGNNVEVCCRVDNPGADGTKNCVTGSVQVAPGKAETLIIELPRKPGKAKLGLFGMRGYPGGGADRSIDPTNVVNLVIFVPNPTEDHVFEIDNIRTQGKYEPQPSVMDDPNKFFPFIDEFGQYIHKDWPGKTHSLKELTERRSAEAKELAAKPAPPGWDKYGGWKDGPTLKATGFFYAAKHEGKWWLVDPEGKLFFSHGVDCVNGWEGGTPVDERDTWFRDLPRPDSDFKTCYHRAGRSLHGHYAGKTPMCFDFGQANLMRKYGEKWLEDFTDVTHRRLRSWGVNTIANWSDPRIYLVRRTPYTATVHFGGKLLEGSQGYWGKFRDVFDPSFKEEIRRSMASRAGKEAGDPWCIGFFVDNEIAWGDETSLAVAALASPPEQAAKKVFMDDLKPKYGTIEKLNDAWGTKHASWDALLAHRQPPDKKKANEDLITFNAKSAETYFRVVREAVKEVAPNQLYLGCRFAWVNPVAAEAAAKHCDVVSYNLYRRSIADFKFPGKADVPLIVGEFHFGALDRGMFHTGLVALASQAERAKTYKDYLAGALRHPNFVGTHWFKYMDEPTTGRALDEENYQIGFVDIADTPYAETIEALRDVGYGMYQTRAGK
jgi:hypothetical protein